MAEGFPETAKDDSSSFNDFMRHHSPIDEAGIENYYEIQDALRLSDQPVWIVRNFMQTRAEYMTTTLIKVRDPLVLLKLRA